jgi:hypothetical protein
VRMPPRPGDRAALDSWSSLGDACLTPDQCVLFDCMDYSLKVNVPVMVPPLVLPAVSETLR